MDRLEYLRARVTEDLEQTERAQPATDHKPKPRDFLDGYCEALRWVLTWMGPPQPPCHCTHEAGDSPCPLHGMDEEVENPPVAFVCGFHPGNDNPTCPICEVNRRGLGREEG